MFKTEELNLEAIVEMVEKEFPTAIWAAGRCRCGDDAGGYAGTISDDDDYAVQGWAVHAHGKTPADALGIAYGQALGEGRS